MADILLEIGICLTVAVILMIVHELAKSICYLLLQKKQKEHRQYLHSIWAVWRYLDPVGLLLSVVCYVPVSKPYLFRIRDRKTNRILGAAGFLILSLLFVSSVLILRGVYGGAAGLSSGGSGLFEKVTALFFQYMAILSLDMFVANLIPVSTFDMGLLIAGISGEKYLGIIKADAVIKMVFVLALLLDIIHYGCIRLLQFIL